MKPAEASAISAVRSRYFPDAVATIIYGSYLQSCGAQFQDIDVLFVSPSGRSILKKSLAQDGLHFDTAEIPLHAIPHLPAISLKAKMPMGLFALANGVIIQGALEEFAELQVTMQEAIVDLNQALQRQADARRRHAADFVATVASAADNEARKLMGFIALSKLLEIELGERGADNFATRSGLRKTAAQNPQLIGEYHAVWEQLRRGELELFLQKSAQLSAGLSAAVENRSARIDLTVFGL